MVFDIKYDLRHNARLVSVSKWILNEIVDIYSGVVCMDTVRNGSFLGELYGLSYYACDNGSTFYYGKPKDEVYIIAGTEFGAKYTVKA
jgi:hypothetical protein